jgi:hypothetical protein
MFMWELVGWHKSAMLRLIITAGVLLCTNPLISQQNYVVFGKVSVSEGNVQGTEAKLQYDSSNLPIVYNEKGEFKCNLNWNQDYLFIFSKTGFIAKSIRFSTKIPENVDLSTIEPYLLLVELSPVMPNVDTAFFENPVGFIKFDPIINDFDFDRDYSLKVKYSAPVQKKKSDVLIDNQLNKKPNEVGIQKKKTSNINTVKSIKNAGLLPVTNESLKNQRGLLRPKSLFVPDFPPLLDDYPPGKTREEFVVPGRKVTRVVLKENGYLKVLLKVNHDWGGVYFFINEAPNYYRGITRETYIKLSGDDGRKQVVRK